MRISLIASHMGVYGGTRRAVEVANRLNERGHDVTIFHSDGSPCEWLECLVPIRSANDALRIKHDILVYAGPDKVSYNIVRKARARKKVFLVLSLPLPTDFLNRSCLKLYLKRDKRYYYLKKFLFSDHKKITTSSGMHNYLKDMLGIDSDLAVSGVNTDLFRPTDVNKNRKEIRILYSGDPRANKNAETVFEALEQVKRKNPHVMLDSYHGLGIPQDLMAEKYSSADIFVDAQLYGTWNNPVAEAMACGATVVCTDILGGRDFVFNEKTALVVPFLDAAAIQESVSRLIENESIRVKLRKGALNHIAQFTWDKSIGKLEYILGGI